jgi:hypothetical protein
MRKLAIIVAFCVAPTGLLAADWTATGQNGTTVMGSGTCSHGTGVLTCYRSSTITGSKGKVFNRTGTRVTDSLGTTKSFTTTNASGRSVSTTRVRHRN